MQQTLESTTTTTSIIIRNTNNSSNNNFNIGSKGGKVFRLSRNESGVFIMWRDKYNYF